MEAALPSMKEVLAKWVYAAVVVLLLFPFDLFGLPAATAPVALFVGLIFAFVFPMPFPKFNKKGSKYLLQASVVGLGFGMSVTEALKSGGQGMMFTIVSVIGVMSFGVLIGYWLHLNRKTSYLISAGTAICGGSAIAAVGPVLRANDEEMAVSLGVIFILNAIALFIFPADGTLFRPSTDQQFGTWAAISHSRHIVGGGSGRCVQSAGLRDCHGDKMHASLVDHSFGVCHDVSFPRQEFCKGIHPLVHTAVCAGDDCQYISRTAIRTYRRHCLCS